MLQWQPYALIPLAGAVICAIVCWSAWRRRNSTPAARALALTTLGIVAWAAVEVLMYSVSTLDGQITVGLGIYPGVATTVLGTFWLSRVIVDRDATLRPVVWALLLIEPIAITAAAATNGWHHQVIASGTLVGDPPLVVAQVGLFFWLHSAYSYVLLTIGMLGVVKARRTATGLYRRQLTTMLVGPALMSSVNLLTLWLLANGGTVDLTVIGFVLAGVTFWWAVFRQGMLRLVPVARSFVFERVTDALVVIDRQGQVIDLNPAATALIRKVQPALPDNLIGLPYHVLVPGYGPRDRLVDGERAVLAGDRQIDLDIRSGDLTDRTGASIGRVVVARDTTELNDKKRELAAANEQLQEQLRTIERLQEHLAEQAIRDDLTGLYNRRHLMHTLDAELSLAEGTGQPLSVVLLDIDHFKYVNDRFGHAVGDELLVAIAGVLSSSARQGDTVARYGGEEFVMVLPGTTSEQAWNRAQEWRLRCAATAVPTDQGPLSATFSAGVACYPSSGTSSAVLLNAADKALYRAKAEGRDRVLRADTLAA
ncbi:histidine kinase N-terminal 7TM domain-containing protein [Planosporangium flavigriseum]|uniref:GGDEF domain-containing protein n=1 Tax=Planosporangium flavigriseum TaxID=373681 RepID=A0A8J3LJM0_9ACTN|nr:GGDEF domain-containing protein [Planosporangium flavigriseum]